jgi:hypothetical protein
MLHKYTRFYLEMNAMKKWLFKLYNHNELKAHTVQAASALDAFTDLFCPSYLWNHLDKVNIPSATKAEKVAYLTEMGCTVREIQSLLGMAPNSIIKIQKEPANIRHPQDDPGLNNLIEHWDKFKNILPKEIFKKC